MEYPEYPECCGGKRGGVHRARPLGIGRQQLEPLGPHALALGVVGPECETQRITYKIATLQQQMQHGKQRSECNTR